MSLKRLTLGEYSKFQQLNVFQYDSVFGQWPIGYILVCKYYDSFDGSESPVSIMVHQELACLILPTAGTLNALSSDTHCEKKHYLI